MQENLVSSYFGQMSSSGQHLLKAHENLQQKIAKDPSFVISVIQYLANSQQNIKENEKEYFNIIVLIHPVLIEEFSSLPSNIQEDVRSGLLSSVVAIHTSLKCVSRLGLIIRQILQIDSLEPWFEPIGQLVKWIGSDDVAIMDAGIEFFVHLLKETPYNQPNSELPFYKLAPLLLQNLFQVFAHPDLSELMRQKLLYLVLQLVKTFSMLDGFQDEIVSQCFDGTFELWMSIFISALQGSINLNINIKKYILKILVIIFRDMQRYLMNRKYHQPNHIYVIWEFSYKILPLYLWNHVWDQPFVGFPAQSVSKTITQPSGYPYYDEDSDSTLMPVESLVHTILQFISILTSVPLIQSALKISIHHLTNVLFHFMLMTESDSKGWKYNNNHFTMQGANIDHQATIRNKCIGIINELIQKFGDLAIQAVLIVSQKFLLNLNQQSTTKTLTMLTQSYIQSHSIQSLSNGIYQTQPKYFSLIKQSSCDVKESMKLSGQSWRKIQVGLLILGRFSEDIIVFQSKQTGGFDIQSFVKGIVSQIKEEEYYSLLKGQSLYCLTRYTEIISIKYRHLFGQLLIAAACCNSYGYCLPLRLISCKALSMFFKKMEKHKLELNKDQLQYFDNIQIIERIMEIPMANDSLSLVLEALVEFSKNQQLRHRLNKPQPQYFLSIFHQCLKQPNYLSLFTTLLEGVSDEYQIYRSLALVFVQFGHECLKAYNGIIHSQQKKQLRSVDTQLILTSLKVAGVFVQKSRIFQQSVNEKGKMIELIPICIQILDENEDIQVQIAISIYLKSLLKNSSDIIIQSKQLIDHYINSVRILLKIPKDKSFQSAAIYAGNLIILLFDKLLKKNHNEILQEIVLKVFRSRTPSVIQSLVLVYSRLINLGTTKENQFKVNSEMQSNVRSVIDFLSSFSIENRMGLKILIDKWLLQQSLFRGRYTKMSTYQYKYCRFMALSKLFLISDKRVDNLLVIGFNPSHTNINNDVNAPLKILATLIRCLGNELSGLKGRNEDSDDDFAETQTKDEGGLQVNLQKFKQQQKPEDQLRMGGLADRQNQQGSTCYMSAMLEFYDDGEQCDDKTQQDLAYLQDSSTQFVLSEYLTQFFQYLASQKTEYLRECLKGLLREDVRNLQKYIKI